MDKDVDLLTSNFGVPYYQYAEIDGQKIMHSLGLGRYTFDLFGPVAKNEIVGVVSEAVIE